MISWIGDKSWRPAVAPLLLSRGRRQTSEDGRFYWSNWRQSRQTQNQLEEEGRRNVSRPRPGAGTHRRFWSSGQQVAINVEHTHLTCYTHNKSDTTEKWNGLGSSFLPQNWSQIIDFTRSDYFHTRCKFICSPLHKHTLVASLNFGKFRPKGEFNYSLCCSPASPHWLRGLDMLIKPELIKRSLGLRVSLPLTSLTAVSIRHLHRLINKKSSFQAVGKCLLIWGIWPHSDGSQEKKKT